MKVWVCRRKTDQSIVDVLELSVHPVLTPDALKTFFCAQEEWTEDALKEFRTPLLSMISLSEATDDQLGSEADKRGYVLTQKIVEKL